MKTNELEKLLMNYLKKVHAPKWAEGITWKKLPLSEINSTIKYFFTMKYL
jgi:hypothetical protein